MMNRRRNVFVSFVIEDEGMIRLLIHQAKDERFPFEFNDYSVKEPFDYKWKQQVRERISLTSAVIIAIGRNTYQSEAVEWEIDEAYQQGKKMIGIRLHREYNDILPDPIIDYGIKVIYWDTQRIAEELE